MRLAECILCGDEAIYLRSYSGSRYCKKCYLRTIEKQVQQVISRHKMLRPEDKIALALSGGKDSVSLLHIMNRIEKKFPLAEMVAVTIDEGIAGYSDEAIEIAKRNCEKLGVEHHIYSFKKFFSHTMDDLATAAKERGRTFLCAYCGILRRKALNIAARDVKAVKLATAHNLDDEVQSMVMNLLRGDLNRMSKNDYNLVEDNSLVPRIKPLRELPEREIALYTFLKKIKFQSFTCNYLETSLRSDVRRFLNMLEEKHAGMKFTLYRSFEKIQATLPVSERRMLGRCGVCGESTTGDTCMACRILMDLNLVKN